MVKRNEEVIRRDMDEKYKEKLNTLKITDEQYKVVNTFFRIKPMLFFIKIDGKCITDVLQEPIITFSYALCLTKEFIRCGFMLSKKEGRKVIYRHTPKGKKLKEAVEIALIMGIKVK